MLSENGFSHALGQVLRYAMNDNKEDANKCPKRSRVIALNEAPSPEQIAEAKAFRVRCWCPQRGLMGVRR
jgi:hypothetical protein